MLTTGRDQYSFNILFPKQAMQRFINERFCADNRGGNDTGRRQEEFVGIYEFFGVGSPEQPSFLGRSTQRSRNNPRSIDFYGNRTGSGPRLIVLELAC